MQGIYNDVLIGFEFDSRCIRSKDALCTQVDERACLVSRSARSDDYLVEADWHVFRFLKILPLDERDESSRAFAFQRSHPEPRFSAR